MVNFLYSRLKAFAVIRSTRRGLRLLEVLNTFKAMILSWFERMISHIGTENGPSLIKGQQWRIFDNGRKLDRVMLRG